jgi:hypothetical protein
VEISAQLIQDQTVPVMIHIHLPHYFVQLVGTLVNKGSTCTQDKMEINRGSRHFMAFGGGLRLCVGADFSKLQMAIFLHFLVTKYRCSYCFSDDRTWSSKFSKCSYLFHFLVTIYFKTFQVDTIRWRQDSPDTWARIS